MLQLIENHTILIKMNKSDRFCICLKWLLVLAVSFFYSLSTSFAEDEKKLAHPPSKVVVSEVKSGSLAPQGAFIGTIYYTQVSHVASEMGGIIETVQFEEGHRVQLGQPLVKLDTSLLQKKIEATQATHAEIIAAIDDLTLDLQRTEKLRDKQFIPEQTYDNTRFKLKSLQHKGRSVELEMQRLQIELKKATVNSPFDGVVVKRDAEPGEWLNAGTVFAAIAKDDVVDIIVDVPERILHYLSKSMKATVKANNQVIQGTIYAIVPKGDVATRTFPIKIRIPNVYHFIEGMRAEAILPEGEPKETLLVSRDALITQFGENVIFVVVDGVAKMIPVKVIGYEGLLVGVEGQGLTKGMLAVVKGNERIRDGAPVEQ
jgi:RND family efflux transporter MFP subunit